MEPRSWYLALFPPATLKIPKVWLSYLGSWLAGPNKNGGALGGNLRPQATPIQHSQPSGLLDQNCGPPLLPRGSEPSVCPYPPCGSLASLSWVY